MRRFLLPLLAAVFVAPTASAQGAPPPLTVGQAVELALTHNPDLAAAGAEVDATGGARVQAGVRRNPEVAMLLEDTRRETRSTTLQINQPIELGGKRDARMAAAERGVDVARSDLDARRHAVRAAVVTAFFDLLAVQERMRVAEAALVLAQRSSQAASQRVTAGKVSPVEETKARVAEAGVRIELLQVRSEEVGARARLANAIGLALGPRVLGGSLADLPAVPLEAAVRGRLGSAPSLRRAELEAERRKALTALESARRMQDVTVSVGARRNQELGLTQAVIGLSIPLPLFDRNQGNLMEAMKREDKARLELDAVRVQTESDAIQARERLASARAEAQALQTEVLPGAQSAYDAAAKGFELGKFSFLEALDAQRTLLQARTQYLRALAEAHRAGADLNRILGIDGMSGPQ